MTDTPNPIEAAVRPLRAEAIECARHDAAVLVERIRDDLAAAGNDRQICAPMPDTLAGVVKYRQMAARRRLVVSLTRARAATRRSSEPDLADIDETAVARFIAAAAADAAAQYDAFVIKLITKIGGAVEARLEGNHVWSYSHLHVVTDRAERQIWHTHRIVNYTKYGRPYNQWPTRRMKG